MRVTTQKRKGVTVRDNPSHMSRKGRRSLRKGVLKPTDFRRPFSKCFQRRRQSTAIPGTCGSKRSNTLTTPPFKRTTGNIMTHARWCASGQLFDSVARRCTRVIRVDRSVAKRAPSPCPTRPVIRTGRLEPFVPPYLDIRHSGFHIRHAALNHLRPQSSRPFAASTTPPLRRRQLCPPLPYIPQTWSPHKLLRSTSPAILVIRPKTLLSR
jgi:hypothetical protein